MTLGAAPQCNGRHVVFGEFVSGMEVLRALERRAASRGAIAIPVAVTDCCAHVPLVTPTAGSWYDRPDGETCTGVAPEFVVLPRVGVLAPTRLAAKRFERWRRTRRKGTTITWPGP